MNPLICTVRRPVTRALWLAFTLTSGCAAASTEPPEVTAPDAWATVDSLVKQSVATNAIPGLGLVVYDANDRVVFRKMYGDFAADRRVAVASASKLVAGLLLLDLVAKGQLALDRTTAQVLGWTGPSGTITLRHLLSFTSGLVPGAPCTIEALTTLAACVEQIRGNGMLALPGTRYDYGSTHLQVAARMAEVATGRSWNQLFRERLATPLGLDAGVQFFTFPRNALGTGNPLVAGGLRTSMDEYAKLLLLAFHKGSYGGLTIGSPALFDEQAREPYPDVVIGASPMKDASFPYRYGLASWLMCTTPAAGCATLSSPGAFGFTPWYDRAAGYSAIIGTELSGVDSGIAAVNVSLAEQIAPHIRAALGR